LGRTPFDDGAGWLFSDVARYEEHARFHAIASITSRRYMAVSSALSSAIGALQAAS
jgi:hypothetical protein